MVLALLAVALAVNAFVTARETQPAEADIGRVLELPGPDLQVRERGPERAPAILLVHCYTCSMHYWQRVEPLLASDRRVISVDLLGHGGSEKPRDGYSIEDQADAIAQALRRLDPGRVVAVGQSLGGPVVTALAERHRGLVRGIVLMDSASRSDFVDLPLTARIAQAPVIGPALKRVTPDALVRDGLSRAFADGFEVPDQFVRDVKRMTFTAFRESGGEGYLDEQRLDDRLAGTGLPALVVFGAEDRMVDPASADDFRDVPGGRVVVLPGVGHTPQVERPRRSAALIRGIDRAVSDR
ncbi:MAG: alpha/beta fold hydrolase [Thermoleophilaceae bacterium]